MEDVVITVECGEARERRAFVKAMGTGVWGTFGVRVNGAVIDSVLEKAPGYLAASGRR